MRRIVLIGGNPKGHAEPFDSTTLSGSRLHAILDRHNLKPEIYDMTQNRDDKPTGHEIVKLLEKVAGADSVFFLGRFVERRLRPFIPNGVYLPHPASRRPSDVARLESALARTAS